MKQLIIAGSGAGGADSITLQVMDAISQSQTVVFQTKRIPIYANIATGREVLDCDHCYETAEDFDALGRDIYEFLAGQPGEVCYVVFGGGLEDSTAEAAARLAVEAGIPVQMLPGISLADSLCAACGYFGAKVCLTAVDCLTAQIEPAQALAVTCLDNRLLAGEVKCRLMELYDPDQKIYFYSQGKEKAETCALWEMDRKQDLDHTTCILIEPVPFENLASYSTLQLLHIMQRLRAFDGCPWDREQTHESLLRYLVEEAYEVIDAVNSGDMDALADELGDVLLQVVFHAQIAVEQGEFQYNDITGAVCKKMIQRHPHIFGDVSVKDSSEVLKNWESIKKEERHQSHSQVMQGIIRSMPALMRADKVVDKARHAGLKYTTDEVLEKLDNVVGSLNSKSGEAEIGRLLFLNAAVARTLGVQPEMALNAAVSRFIDGFCQMESQLSEAQISFEQLSEQERQVKRMELLSRA